MIAAFSDRTQAVLFVLPADGSAHWASRTAIIPSIGKRGRVGPGNPPADGGHEEPSPACRLRVRTGRHGRGLPIQRAAGGLAAGCSTTGRRCRWSGRTSRRCWRRSASMLSTEFPCPRFPAMPAPAASRRGPGARRSPRAQARGRSFAAGCRWRGWRRTRRPSGPRPLSASGRGVGGRGAAEALEGPGGSKRCRPTRLEGAAG